MEEPKDINRKLNEDDLEMVTGGAAVPKAQMMQLTCDGCGKTFFADVTKKEVKCKHCGAPKKLAG